MYITPQLILNINNACIYRAYIHNIYYIRRISYVISIFKIYIYL